MKKRHNCFKSNLNPFVANAIGNRIQLEIPKSHWTKLNNPDTSKLKIISNFSSRPNTAVGNSASNRNSYYSPPVMSQARSEKLFSEDSSHQQLIEAHKKVLKKSSNLSTKHSIINKDSFSAQYSLNLSFEKAVQKKLRPFPVCRIKTEKQVNLISYKKKGSKNLNSGKVERARKESNIKDSNPEMSQISVKNQFFNLFDSKKNSKKSFKKILKSSKKRKNELKEASPLLISAIGKILII